ERRQHREHGAEHSMLRAGRAFESALREVHVAEEHGDEGGDGGGTPQVRRSRGEIPVLVLARRPFEADERDDDPERNVQDDYMETAQEIDQVHIALPHDAVAGRREPSGTGSTRATSKIATM